MERSSIPLTGRDSVVMPEVLFTCSEGKGGAANLEEESGGFWGMGCDLGRGKKGKTLAGWLGTVSGRWRLRLGLELPREGQETELAGPGREENGAGVCVCVCVLNTRSCCDFLRSLTPVVLKTIPLRTLGF